MIIDIDSKAAQARVDRVRSGLTLTKMDKVIGKVAHIARRRLLKQTPKRWTGHTRKSWRVIRNKLSNYSVINTSKVMVFLEKGTKAHGPKKAKRLFVPLNRRTALAGPKRVAAANKGAPSGKKPFVFGKDYVLSKRVRGIKAMHIVRNYRPLVTITLQAAMKLYIRHLLR